MFKNHLIRLTKVPIVREFVLFCYRALQALRYLSGRLWLAIRWLFESREHTNYSYDLTAANKDYLGAFVCHITGRPFAEVRGYITELEQDTELISHVQKLTAASEQRYVADRQVRFSKRLGWYAFVRAMKPAVVVETGLDKGLGSCVIARALQRNAQEGVRGHYYGTDINPKAGYLFSGELAQFGTLLYGDSLESLRKLPGTIDLFINDSDHSADYECAEYELIKNKLSPTAVVLGDNAHATEELFKFSMKYGRGFLFFGEQPLGHWYPGGGIGASFPHLSGSRPQHTT